MDNLLTTDGTFAIPQTKGNGIIVSILEIGTHRVNQLARYLLPMMFALWLIFLSVGLIVSIFGANLAQQKYASVHKIDTNSYLRRACQSKLDAGFANIFEDKLRPDAAQCFGIKIATLIEL